jgi:hypothetical protein
VPLGIKDIVAQGASPGIMCSTHNPKCRRYGRYEGALQVARYMLRVIHWGTDFCVNSRIGVGLGVYLFICLGLEGRKAQSSKLKAKNFGVLIHKPKKCR